MASGKVARRTAVADVAELLDSPEVAALIGALAPQGRGRKGFGPRTLVGACLVKTRECVGIICLRKGRTIPLSPIPHGSDEWKQLYRGPRSRGARVREFEAQLGPRPASR